MNRAMIVVRGTLDRERAAAWARNAPFGTRIEFKQTKRTLPQNDKLWALLTILSRQLAWHGEKLRPEDWKLIMLDALKRELHVVPNVDGTGVVSLGRSSSDLSKQEMSELIELILAFGAQHGVDFGEAEAA